MVVTVLLKIHRLCPTLLLQEAEIAQQSFVRLRREHEELLVTHKNLVSGHERWLMNSDRYPHIQHTLLMTLCNMLVSQTYNAWLSLGCSCFTLLPEGGAT